MLPPDRPAPSTTSPGPVTPPASASTRPIDALVRRVVMTMFAAGGVAVLLNWVLEVREGTLNRLNAIAYPIGIVICAGLLFTLWRWPRMLRPVRLVGYAAVLLLLLPELWSEAGDPQPMVGNYNAVTLLNWLPLCYALAFFLLQARAAMLAAAALLADVTAVALWRGSMALPSAAMDRDMLLNAAGSHVVLLVCLSSLMWLKRVVTRQDEQAQHLRLLAGTDPLTGLANRRHALTQLERLASDRRAGTAPAVVLGDLDHFKRINDRHGHETGDHVLCEVAHALRAVTRDTDTVARWGGEEFLVVLPHTRAGEARELAERLRRCVEQLDLRDGKSRPVAVTISLGVAELGDWDGVAAWLRRADEALYRAKAAGRNRCELAEPGLPPEPAEGPSSTLGSR